MTSFQTKQPLFHTKSKKVHIDLWIFAETIFRFSFQLLFFMCCCATLYFSKQLPHRTLLTNSIELQPFYSTSKIILISLCFSFSHSVVSVSIFSFFHSCMQIMKPVSNEEPVSNAIPGVDRVLLVPIVEEKYSIKIRSHFNISGLHMKRFLKWILSLNTVPAIKIVNKMRFNAATQ